MDPTGIKDIVLANAKAAYEDAAQPSVRVVGKALAQCVSLFVTPVGRTAEILEKNLTRYIDKLDATPQDQLLPPETRILVPVLEKMRYTEEEKVADYYAEILAAASRKDQAKRVMVTFIEILNRLSADEIRILEFIHSRKNLLSIATITPERRKENGLPDDLKTVDMRGSLPLLELRLSRKGQQGYNVHEQYYSIVIERLGLDEDKNFGLYIENMISLGLLEQRQNVSYAIHEVYEELEQSSYLSRLRDQLDADSELQTARERLDSTSLGKKLLSLCSEDYRKGTL